MMFKKLAVIFALTLGFYAKAQIANPGFEIWEDSVPAGWTIGEGFYEADPLFKYDGQFSIRMSTITTQKALWLNNTLKQKFSLEANKTYHLKFAVAQANTGTTTIKLYPIVKNRRQKELVTFGAWSFGYPFLNIERKFFSADFTEFELEVKHYANKDGFAWIDAISLEEVRDAEKQKDQAGLYSLSAMYDFTGEIPPEAFYDEAVVMVNTRNETEIRNVFFLADKDYDKVELKVTSLKQLPASSVRIFDLEDAVLLPHSARPIKKGEVLAFQVAVKTDESIPVANASGKIELQADGASLHSLPLHVQIVDIVLPPADISFLMYYAEAYTPERFLTDELREAYYRDMAEHGMNNITIYNNPQDGKKADFRYNYGYHSRLIPEEHRQWDPKKDKNANFEPKKWEKLYNFGLDQQMALAAKYNLIQLDKPVMWLVNKRGNYGWGGMPTTALKDALRKWRKRTDWPEPLLYVQDEPYDMPDRIESALNIFAGLKKAKIDVRTVTAHPHPDILGKFYDVWVLSASQVDIDNVRKALELNKEIWAYVCDMPNTNAAFFRALYGFWAYKSALQGVATWAYYDARERFVQQEDGTLIDHSSRLSRVGLSESGPIATIAWEATREGTEDYRLVQYYVALMKKLDDERNKNLQKAESLLDKEAVKIIKKRETALVRKQDPNNPPPEWTAENKKQKQGEEYLLKYLKLESIYNHAKTAQRLLNAIGSISPYSRTTDKNIKRDWHPNLGEENRPDDAELKRILLIPFVQMLKENLE